MRISSPTRRILGSIGLCSMSDGAPTCFIIYQWLVFATNLTLLTMRGVAAMLYMWHYIEVGHIECILYAGLRVAATFTALGTSIAMAIRKEKFRAIIDGFQMIRDLSKYSGIYARLCCIRAEDTSENGIKLYFIIGIYCVIALLFAAEGGFSRYIQSGYVQPFKLFLKFKRK